MIYKAQEELIGALNGQLDNLREYYIQKVKSLELEIKTLKRPLIKPVHICETLMPNDPGHNFCWNCGADLKTDFQLHALQPTSKLRCSFCIDIEPKHRGGNFCWNCGRNLKQ